ncbi:hypothetical protein [Streptomyces fagopyri]|uniref:hypothetical protein n=1 Tax=Streptomyces fagopyri TaxID=2662397 RepID=UPI0033F60C63
MGDFDTALLHRISGRVYGAPLTVGADRGARLPAHDITGLLRELVVAVYAGDGGGPFRWDRAVRGALAGLLCRDIESPDPPARYCRVGRDS